MSNVPFPTAGNVDNAVFPLLSPNPENTPFADTLHHETGDAVGFGIEENLEVPFPDAGEFTQPAVTGVAHIDANSDAEKPFRVVSSDVEEAPKAEEPVEEKVAPKAEEKAEEKTEAKAEEKPAADEKAAASKTEDAAPAEAPKVVAPKGSAKA